VRLFVRLGAHDGPEAALDEAAALSPLMPTLHAAQSAPCVGVVELDPLRAMDAYAELAGDLRRRACELEALAEVVRDGSV